MKIIYISGIAVASAGIALSAAARDWTVATWAFSSLCWTVTAWVSDRREQVQ